MGAKSSALAHAYSELYGLLFSGFLASPIIQGAGEPAWTEVAIDRGCHRVEPGPAGPCVAGTSRPGADLW